MNAINAAFEDGRLGPLREPFEAKLRAQMQWLLAAAGIEESVAVNRGIERSRLNVIVTTPEVESYTGCGRGNAIYSPELDSIFIDRDLILPEEIYLIGESYPGSLVDLNNSDIHYSYLNFILAHELGHRQDRDVHGRPAAFFHYAAFEGGAGVQTTERAADLFAVQTLMNAILTLGPPDFFEQRDVLAALGLDLVDIDRKDNAAAEIVGAVYSMSVALLFSGSPYSPFHFDKEHPSFIDRSLTALGRVDQTLISQRAAAHFSYFTAQMTALSRLSGVHFNEVYFDDPLFRSDYRDGQLWFGTYGLPRHNRARIVKVAPSDLTARDAISHAVVSADFSGPDDRDTAEIDAADWLKLAFEPRETRSSRWDLPSSHPTSILPPGEAVSKPERLVLPSHQQTLAQDNGLQVDDAVRIGDSWFIPGLPPFRANTPQHWTLWRYRPGPGLERLVEGTFLISEVVGRAEGSFLRDYDPYLERLRPLRDGRLLIWFTQDSMYLVDPDRREVTPIFTPVIKGLQVLEIPPHNLLVWAYNGRKAYLVDIERHGNDEGS